GCGGRAGLEWASVWGTATMAFSILDAPARLHGFFKKSLSAELIPSAMPQQDSQMPPALQANNLQAKHTLPAQMRRLPGLIHPIPARRRAACALALSLQEKQPGRRQFQYP